MTIPIFIAAGVFLLVLLFASETVVPWIGHFVIKVLTFGKIDLGWRPSDLESEVSQRVGFFILLLVAGLVAMIVHK